MTNDAFPRGTERLILRHLAPDDADTIRELYGDWQISQWLSRLSWPFTSEDAEVLIAEAAIQFARGSGFLVAIEARASSMFVGTISLRLPAYEPDPWTTDTSLGILGYAIASAQQGNGFASEAASSVVRLAFDHMQLDRVRATVLRDNVPSRRLLERLGFTIRHADVRETPRYGGPPRLGDTLMLERADFRGV
jgi:RimJ/RimL family protein N-acetyltransferase